MRLAVTNEIKKSNKMCSFAEFTSQSEQQNKS